MWLKFYQRNGFGTGHAQSEYIAAGLQSSAKYTPNVGIQSRRRRCRNTSGYWMIYCSIISGANATLFFNNNNFLVILFCFRMENVCCNVKWMNKENKNNTNIFCTGIMTLFTLVWFSVQCLLFIVFFFSIDINDFWAECASCSILWICNEAQTQTRRVVRLTHSPCVNCHSGDGLRLSVKTNFSEQKFGNFLCDWSAEISVWKCDSHACCFGGPRISWRRRFPIPRKMWAKWRNAIRIYPNRTSNAACGRYGRRCVFFFFFVFSNFRPIGHWKPAIHLGRSNTRHLGTIHDTWKRRLNAKSSATPPIGRGRHNFSGKTIRTHDERRCSSSPSVHSPLLYRTTCNH